MIPAVETKVRVVFPKKWRALTLGVSSYGKEFPTILSFAMNDVNQTGAIATGYLRSILQKEVYGGNASTLRVEGGKVLEGRSGQFYKSVRLTPADRVEAMTTRGISGVGIKAGIFDLKEAAKMTSHRSRYKYYELLENGIPPFVLSTEQLKAFFVILNEQGLYNKNLAETFKKTGGPGGVHKGIEPKRFFQRTMWYWHDILQPLMANLVNRYLDYVISQRFGGKIKEDVIQSTGIGGPGFPEMLFKIKKS